MLTPSETSYFSPPQAGLDPRLFKAGKLSPNVRSAVLQLLFNHLNDNYTGAEFWAYVWLAGSGVSYQWAAQRNPGDLDCLVGINFPQFRESNSQFRGLSDKEIADTINEGFRKQLHPITESFLGSFELTFYVNTQTDITKIKPYAAYSITDDDWTVEPNLNVPDVNPAWEKSAEQDRLNAIQIVTDYVTAKNKFDQATNEAVKANSRSELRIAMSRASTMFDSIHNERNSAFSPTGGGYTDFANYRWQAGKRSGVIQALRGIKKKMEEQDKEFAQRTYGTELPEANTLIRRAALNRNS